MYAEGCCKWTGYITVFGKFEYFFLERIIELTCSEFSHFTSCHESEFIIAEIPGHIAERSAGNLLPGVPWIEASDVAELVLYLASDRARYASGAQFTLDAGLLTR